MDNNSKDNNVSAKTLGYPYSVFCDKKVLLVGAGGIGCELLKNLVMSNFGEIHLIDLDTIDLSNLNRQFLFRKQHIKQPKAIVAAKTAQAFNEHVKIHPYHANIKDPEFSVAWFRNFDIVFNALDNLDARRHVNRQCLLANVPLIESGTTGFLGQVQVIHNGQTECYDCNPKETPKQYPVCTIRSTPNLPIHCVVWAKSYLFPNLFETTAELDTSIDTSASDAEQVKEIAELQRETEELKQLRNALTSEDDACRRIFVKVFCDDIERLRSVPDMWTHRKEPTPLDFDELITKIDSDSKPWVQDRRIWSLADNLAVFYDSCQRLRKRVWDEELKSRKDIDFDKDDKDTMDFVASAANLRAHVFGIPTLSEFDIKQMAGNIIPAIATTNAVVAGICVIQALKVLTNGTRESMNIYLSRRPERVFHGERVCPPNPFCQTCNFVSFQLPADISQLTLGEFISKVLQEYLQYSDEISILRNDLIYDPDFDDNVDKPLSELLVDAQPANTLTVLGEAEGDSVETLERVPLLVEFVPLDQEHDRSVKFVLPETQIEIPKKQSPEKQAQEAEEMNELKEAVNPEDKELIVLDEETIIIEDELGESLENGDVVSASRPLKRSVTVEDDITELPAAGTAVKKGKLDNA
ncbi:SUMO E1-like activator enzyme Fub2 [Schizosaccharomyces japonicus yFS275]|uniref:Ubiquitin-activating enzyme E1-like n=1 Tax=Schizosaccharomyces japonicus (strain yFS275 / FY16936) TaxID=402676 RepID=B6JW36_SCHJY|nr:SUMO E1-like activator enzyme Fub2 [Schizosaccharomyces japonicus yFS275]EEB05587.1 SUMO E1-like activator enzyme Fub2 [Schizosaccharomyces japonicus yFS275]